MDEFADLFLNGGYGLDPADYGSWPVDFGNMAVGGDYGISPEWYDPADYGSWPVEFDESMLNPVAGWNMSGVPWGPLALLGGTLGSQYMGSQSATSQAEANWNKQFETWKQFAFPSQEAVNASSDYGKKQINQAMPAAMQQLDEKLAGRGFSPGSGAIAKGYTDLEKQRVQDMGQLASKMAIMKNTPMFSPMGYPYTKTFGENLANTVGGISSFAGALALDDWMKKNL